jgi:hypothetical protein
VPRTPLSVQICDLNRTFCSCLIDYPRAYSRETSLCTIKHEDIKPSAGLCRAMKRELSRYERETAETAETNC